MVCTEIMGLLLFPCRLNWVRRTCSGGRDESDDTDILYTSHRFQYSNTRGLRPSTRPLGHRVCQQYIESKRTIRLLFFTLQNKTYLQTYELSFKNVFHGGEFLFYF